MSAKKSKFVSLSQLASKATGGAYGSQAHQAPSLPPSSSTLGTPNPHSGSTPHTPRTPGGSNGNSNGNGGGSGSNSSAMDKKRATWADRVREKMPPLEENEYEVLWERGVLGVIFLESEKDGIPYVSKATESCISPLVAPGDILKFVNVVRSKDHSFSDFFRILATMKKPVLLRFERPSKSRPPSPDDSGSSGTSEPLEQRSTSTNEIGGARATMKEAARALAARVNRSNSLPQSENAPQKPVTRGTFWRASSAKETPPPPVAIAPPLTPAVTTPSRRDMKSPIVNLNYDDLSDATDSSSPPFDESNDKSLFNSDGDDVQLVDVLWETGSLGLLFGEERGTGYPVVTRSTPDVNPHVYRLVRVNDVLLSANGIRSTDYKFDAFFARLQQMRKPVKLVFRRKISPAGTPPPRGRNTSASSEETSEPTVAVSTSQSKLTSNSDAAAPMSRPTRLPPTENVANGEVEGLIPAPSAVVMPHSNQARQERSSSTKSRSPSVETHSLMEEERSPGNGTLRGKSPPTRPDIVYLGSPKKKPRQPPPSPPSRHTVDVPSSQSNPSKNVQRTPSPEAKNLPTSSPSSRSELPKQKQNKRQSAVYDLGNDNGPMAYTSELIDDDEEEMGVDEDVEHGVEVVAHGIDDAVAIGVPVDSSGRLSDDTAVEAAEVVEAVLAVAVDEPESRSSVKLQPAAMGSQSRLDIDEGLPVSEKSTGDQNEDENDEDSDDSSSQTSSESESDEGEPLDSISIEQDDPDISGDLDNNEMLGSDPKSRGSISSPTKPNKAALNASLAKYRKKAKNSRPLVKLPAITEDTSQTVPLAAPNAVNTNVQVRGRSKPKPSLVDTPDSSTYLVKWKEGRSVGLQLREVRVAKGTFPLVVDVCKEPCCDVLKHVCIGDMIVEINGRNCSTMGVKKTVNFLKTSSKTMLLKLRRGPAFMNERVSAYA